MTQPPAPLPVPFKTAIFVNSFVDRPGNIGLRTGHVIRALAARGGAGFCVCRGAQAPKASPLASPTSSPASSPVKMLGMGPIGHVPRILNGIRIYLAPRFRHRMADIRLFEAFARRGLARMRRDPAYRVAHLWESSPRLIAALKAQGARVVLDVPIAPASYPKRLLDSGTAPFFTYDPDLMAQEQAALAAADLIIAPSAFVRDEIARLGIAADRVRVVPFGVATDMPPAAHLETPPAKGDPLAFCFLGAVNLRKGMGDLLEVWRDPAFDHDRLHLCGRVFPQVTRLLAEAGRGVVQPGFITPREYLPKCHVFVFPSWMEGSAKAVYEAMACGLPAIVTTASGSIVRDGVDGFVIAPGDRDGLRRAMRFFKDNPDKIAAMGAAARARAQAFTWARYADTIVDAYAELAR